MNRDDNIGFNWFHGRISREQAENLLKDVAENGSFLVRESNSSPNDYVLSVLENNQVTHYQIRRHGEDAFFSIEEGTRVHGLDTLIDHYRKEGPIRLATACKGQLPPIETRMYGASNLLHRATMHGDFNLVSQMLACGYENMDAKNQDGQTAVHIAALSGRDDILEILIEYGLTVNVRDTSGYTPLHYTCQNNLPTLTELLIVNGKADSQLRHAPTGRVALHEAAYWGHIECVKVLVKHKAPINPRTLNDETPADLAKQNGHTECYNFLKQYKGLPIKENSSRWCHGTMSREEAVAMLRKYWSPNEPPCGTFLVRYSQRQPIHYVLTLLANNQPYNYIIKKENNWYCIDDGPLFDSLESLIEHYSLFLDGLAAKLLYPVAASPKPPVPEFSTMPRKHKLSIFTNTKDEKEPSIEQLARNLSFSSDFSQYLPSSDDSTVAADENVYKVPVSNNNTLPKIIHYTNVFIGEQQHDHIKYIPFEDLTFGAVLGEGEFGSVFQAKYIRPEDDEAIDVAVKTLHSQHIDSCSREFIGEANVMMSLVHPNIVSLLGISLGPPLAMVQELLSMGSLLSYLIKERDSSSNMLMTWSLEIANGMLYLEQRRLVHRDLAARNILLTSNLQAKISDFGLSRSLSLNSSYYSASQGGKWPIKWYAPESYSYGTFSHASDVWSYGVTLWEMYSYGEQPYKDMKGVEAIDFIEGGNRLEEPENCPKYVYALMLKCWCYDAKLRPSFRHILDSLNMHNETKV